MQIRWEWLQPAMAVPYVPTLGPVHPGVVAPGLFAEVLEVAGTGWFLPYDKDRRWGGHKDKQVLTGYISQEPGLLLIPTLQTDHTSCVKVHLYTRDPERSMRRAVALAARLRRQHRMTKAQVVWFLLLGDKPDPHVACTRVQMYTFKGAPAGPTELGVLPLDQMTEPARETFNSFAADFEEGGFAFLDGRMRESRVAGPVLTCEREGKIVGAIGPMEIMPDRDGNSQLLPQYFGVLPEYRRLGLGRCLWRAAMQWGQSHHAAYQLLQTRVGDASDVLCRSEGLTDLGLVCTETI